MQKQLQKKWPTGKPHISFSEIKNWKECPYRHKLVYVDKIDLSEPSPYLDFGTAVHEGCETLLENRSVNKKKLIQDIKGAWEKHGFDNPAWYSKQPGWYKHEPVETWCDWAENMWNDVLGFLDCKFPSHDPMLITLTSLFRCSYYAINKAFEFNLRILNRLIKFFFSLDILPIRKLTI